MAPLTLESKLCAALASRDERLIRRRLAVPSTPGVAGGPIDFSSNDYLSLSQSADLRAAFLAAANDAPPEAILGSGGSRLLVNPPTHAAFEARCERFFNAPAAILFNSGFDANAGFFSCIPQLGDAMVYDEHIHASVHDGVRASRARNSQFPFAHNNVHALETICRRLLRERQTLRQGESAIFVAVESLYSMDGTFAPLVAYADLLEALFPLGNAYLVVDEAHTTGIYGQQGRGLVCALGLEHRVFARLHTFGKALAGSGAVLLVTHLVKDYLLNYARSLIYTTALTYMNVIAVNCAFDMLESGAAGKLADSLLDLSHHLTNTLRPQLRGIPSHILSLPSHLARTSTPGRPADPPAPIIPIMTSQPRPLSAFLAARGITARPITWPTVPKGADRIRVCLHAANTRSDVDSLVSACIEWAREAVREESLAGGQRLISDGVFSAQAKL